MFLHYLLDAIAANCENISESHKLLVNEIVSVTRLLLVTVRCTRLLLVTVRCTRLMRLVK